MSYEPVFNSSNSLKNYKELFSSQSDLPYDAYAVVLFHLISHQFYNALLLSAVKNGCMYVDKLMLGEPITVDEVRKFANNSKDRRAKAFSDISEDNWKEKLGIE